MTVARMRLRLPDGRCFDYAYDFGEGYPESAAEFMWTEGNYACDCNRSRFLAQAGYAVAEMDCGDRIQMESLRIDSEEPPA